MKTDHSIKLRHVIHVGRVVCENLMKNRFRFKLEKFYHHRYFALGVCILFLKPSDFPARIGFCSQVAIFHGLAHPTFANLLAIMLRYSTSFLFRLFSYPPIFKCSACTGPLSSSLSTCPSHRNLCS